MSALQTTEILPEWPRCRRKAVIILDNLRQAALNQNNSRVEVHLLSIDRLKAVDAAIRIKFIIAAAKVASLVQEEPKLAMGGRSITA